MDLWANGWTDRWIGRQTHRQTGRQTHIVVFVLRQENCYVSNVNCAMNTYKACLHMITSMGVHHFDKQDVYRHALCWVSTKSAWHIYTQNVITCQHTLMHTWYRIHHSSWNICNLWPNTADVRGYINCYTVNMATPYTITYRDTLLTQMYFEFDEYILGPIFSTFYRGENQISWNSSINILCPND